MATSSAIEPLAWTRDLLASLGRANISNKHELQIIGHDPVIATRFRAGEAAAAVLAANATAAADLWCARGGRPQRIEVDVRAAAASLVSFLYQRYPGSRSTGARSRRPRFIERAMGDGYICMADSVRAKARSRF